MGTIVSPVRYFPYFMAVTSSPERAQGILQCAFVGLLAMVCSSPNRSQHSLHTLPQFSTTLVFPRLFALTTIFGVFPVTFKAAKFRRLFRERDLVYLVVSVYKLAERDYRTHTY